MMRPVPGNAQHIGDRESQQDAFGFSDMAAGGAIGLVLADGMGGLANGAAASNAAVDAALAVLRGWTPDEPLAVTLTHAVQAAQSAVLNCTNDGAEAGSTIVVAVVWQDRVYWASLGDSRLYLCRGGGPAQQLTRDHTVAALLDQRVADGEISRAEALAATDHEALTDYLGAPQPPQPDIGADGMALHPGDKIIVCSDGIYRALSPADMAGVVNRASPMRAAEQMVNAVRRRALPHQDNMTVMVVRMAARTAAGRLLEPPLRQLGLIAGALLVGTAAAAAGVWLAIGELSRPPPIAAVQVTVRAPPPPSPVPPARVSQEPPTAPTTPADTRANTPANSRANTLALPSSKLAKPLVRDPESMASQPAQSTHMVPAPVPAKRGQVIGATGDYQRTHTAASSPTDAHGGAATPSPRQTPTQMGARAGDRSTPRHTAVPPAEAAGTIASPPPAQSALAPLAQHVPPPVPLPSPPPVVHLEPTPPAGTAPNLPPAHQATPP